MAKRLVIFIFCIMMSITIFGDISQNDKRQGEVFITSGAYDIMFSSNLMHSVEIELETLDFDVYQTILSDIVELDKMDIGYLSKMQKNKYSDSNIKLIVAHNNYAIDYATKIRDDIFENASIMAIDLYGTTAYNYDNIPAFKLFKPAHSNKKILMDFQQVINAMQPCLENIVVVYDDTRLSQKLYDSYCSVGIVNFKRLIPIKLSANYKISLDHYENMTAKNTAVLLLCGYANEDKNSVSYEKSVKNLSEKYELPIYSLFQQNFYGNVLACYSYSLSELKEYITNKSLVVFNGVSIENIGNDDFPLPKLWINSATVDKFNVDIPRETFDKMDLCYIVPSNDKIYTDHEFLLLSIIILIAIIIIIFFIYDFRKHRMYNNIINDSTFYKNIFMNDIRYAFVFRPSTGDILEVNDRFKNSKYYRYFIQGYANVEDYFGNGFINSLVDYIKDNMVCRESLFHIGKDKFYCRAFMVLPSQVEGDLALMTFRNNSNDHNYIESLKENISELTSKLDNSHEIIKSFTNEIRTPLNAIKGFNGLIENESLSQEEKEKYNNYISSNNQRLIRIVDKILFYTELIISGNKIVNQTEININKTIREIVNSFSEDESVKNSEVIISKHFSLTDNKDIIFNDSESFSFIIYELISNALKNTKYGTVEVGYIMPSEGKIIFFVKDTGKGISPEAQKDIFDYFKIRNKDLSSTDSGLGIGLSICKKLVDIIGGEIWFSSNNKEGTTFYFYVEYDMSILLDSHKEQEKELVNIVKNKKILVFDNENIKSKNWYFMLKKYGSLINRSNVFKNNKDFLEQVLACDYFICDESKDIINYIWNNKKILKDNKVKILQIVDKNSESINKVPEAIKFRMTYPVSFNKFVEIIKKMEKHK